jgi:hypothetical protein
MYSHDGEFRRPPGFYAYQYGRSRQVVYRATAEELEKAIMGDPDYGRYRRPTRP